MEKTPDEVLRPTDAQAVALAKSLIRTARSGTIATIEPETGAPQATRVGMSTDIDGAPTILTSRLTAHTKALLTDPRCSLLVGEPGKGDPLAHARVTLACTAREIARETGENTRIKGRYLRHSPKAALYADLGDFRFFRLEPRSASLNAGFGRAYALTAADVMSMSEANLDLADSEADALDHMNSDHAEAVNLFARHFGRMRDGDWRMVGIDVEGFELAQGDEMRRIAFEPPLSSAMDLRPALARMASQAREALGIAPRKQH
jgi:putative heme iron utilization protein